MKNPKTESFDPNRRKFLGACCASVGATGMLSALAQLRLIGAVASADNGASDPNPPGTGSAVASDYKALVCLFLAGGNDSNNLLIPTDNGPYATYSTGRGALAIAQNQLLNINAKSSDGRAWGLHPSFNSDVSGANTGGFNTICTGGHAAFLGNVGTLVYPTTKAQYVGNSVPLPSQLYSHSDQQVEWQSSVPNESFITGWGGRLADLTNAFNSNNTVSMSISLNGQNSFQVGKVVSQFAVNPGGSIALTSSNGATSANLAGIRSRAQNDLLAAQNNNLFETAFAGLTTQSINDSALLSGILSANPFTTAFSGSSLGQQLRAIARIIAGSSSLNLKRQVFFARIGGWDLHDTQLGAHANLFADVSRNLAAFYNATVELGVANQVTTFTASDFGRTFNINGTGTDHGWGSHHIIMGGAVKAGIYGTMPDFTSNGPDDTGRGRWIPSTSVDEYSATLAKWFGVSATNMPLILPNIGHFAKPDLGFLA